MSEKFLAEEIFNKIKKDFNHPSIQQMGKIWYNLKMLELLEKKKSFLKKTLDYSYFMAIQICYMVAGFLVCKQGVLKTILFIGCIIIGAFLLSHILRCANKCKALEENIKDKGTSDG